MTMRQNHFDLENIFDPCLQSVTTLFIPMHYDIHENDYKEQATLSLCPVLNCMFSKLIKNENLVIIYNTIL